MRAAERWIPAHRQDDAPDGRPTEQIRKPSNGLAMRIPGKAKAWELLEGGKRAARDGNRDEAYRCFVSALELDR